MEDNEIATRDVLLVVRIVDLTCALRSLKDLAMWWSVSRVLAT